MYSFFDLILPQSEIPIRNQQFAIRNIFVPIVQRIECGPPEAEIRVQIPVGTL